MKAFAPFALVPVMAVMAWWAVDWLPTTQPPVLPTVATLDAPPALGVVMPDGREHTEGVRVPMTALLPEQPTVASTSVTAPVLRSRAAPAPPAWPQVKAILVHNEHRSAWVDGQALSVGDQVGELRVVAIDPVRVQFEHVRLPLKQWVDVQQP